MTNPNQLSERKISRAKAIWLTTCAGALATGLLITSAPAEKADAKAQAKTEDVAPAKGQTQPLPKKTEIVDAKKLNLAIVDNLGLEQAKADNLKLASMIAVEVANERQNFHPEIATMVLMLEGSFGTAESASGNYAGIKCTDGKECGPPVWTQEDYGDGRGLVWEKHRFEKLKGKTTAEKFRASFERYSELMELPHFADAAAHKDNPDLHLLGLQHKIDQEGDIIYYQGAKGYGGKLLTLSYATVNNYTERIQNLRNSTHSAEIFAPYYE